MRKDYRHFAEAQSRLINDCAFSADKADPGHYGDASGRENLFDEADL